MISPGLAILVPERWRVLWTEVIVYQFVRFYFRKHKYNNVLRCPVPNWKPH
jgi:hypothetical protein